jgi:hypothetical protein
MWPPTHPLLISPQQRQFWQLIPHIEVLSSTQPFQIIMHASLRLDVTKNAKYINNVAAELSFWSELHCLHSMLYFHFPMGCKGAGFQGASW